MVIWLTGLSCSGKTALASALSVLLKPSVPELVMLDGDMIRAAFGNDLGHRESDRLVQVGRIQRLTKLLSDQGLVVVVAVVYARADLLEWNRRNLRGYFEVYLKTSLETVRARDRKGVYRRPDGQPPTNVVGVDIPWHEPGNPDLVLDVDAGESPEVLARRVVNALPQLAQVLEAV